MITIDGLNEIAKAIYELVDKATFEIGGEIIEKPFFRSKVEGNKITLLIYLTEEDQGIIENVKIISKSGATLFENPDFIEKDYTEGFVTGFIINVVEQIIKG